MTKLHYYYRWVVFVPIWLLTIALKPALRKDHPWKGRYLSLRSWVECGTPAAESCGLVFTVTGITLVILTLRLYYLWT